MPEPMKVVVCVNPATGGAVDDADGRIRAGNALVSALRESDAHAVEQALQIAEAERAGGRPTVEIVVVTVGPVEALGALREALALGASRAVLIDDASLRDLDLVALSRVLAAALERERADLYLACTWSGDIDGLLLWTAAGERLGIPVVTQAATFAIDERGVSVTRQSERGDQQLSAAVPCMVELSATINQARYPTLKGRAAAQNKPVALVQPDELGLTGLSPGTTVQAVRPAGHGRATVVVDDPAGAPEAIVTFLRERRLL
jgi:electron transfer flavoprotein beta subunit